MKNINTKEIRMDCHEEIFYGSDQAYVDFPVRFPTVSFMLEDSMTLIECADSIRERDGHIPFATISENDTYPTDGYYNFYLGINDYTKSKLDNCITFTVHSETATDDGEEYVIPLTPLEQQAIYMHLDEQYKKECGMTLADLLANAKEKMWEDD